MGHWSLVISWSFSMTQLVPTLMKSGNTLLEKKRKGKGGWKCMWSFDLFTLLPKRAVNMLGLLSGPSFYICAALSLAVPWHNSPPCHSSQVVLLALIWLLQTGWVSSCVCSSVRSPLPSRRGLYRIRHHSNTSSAFGNRSQSLDLCLKVE